MFLNSVLFCVLLLFWLFDSAPLGNFSPSMRRLWLRVANIGFQTSLRGGIGPLMWSDCQKSSW